MFRKVLASAAICLALTGATARAAIQQDVTGTGEFTDTSSNGVTFIVQGTTVQPAGTGVFKPFLSIQQTGQERGFNTDDTTVNLDEKRLNNPGPGGWTRSVQVGELGTVKIGGQDYIQFVVDANQSGTAAKDSISLNQVQMFVSGQPLGAGYTLTEATPSSNASISFPGLNPVFQMSNLSTASGSNYEIIFDEDNGSGVADLNFYILSSVLAGAHATDYLTLFMQLGNPPGTQRSDAGFEEVAFLGAAAVPEPASFATVGVGTLLGLGFAWRKRKRTVA